MEQKKLIAEQEKKIQDQASMVNEQDKKIREQTSLLTEHTTRLDKYEKGLDALTVRLTNMTNSGVTCNSTDASSDADTNRSTVIEKTAPSSRSSQRIFGKRQHRSVLSEEDAANIHKSVKKKKI